MYEAPEIIATFDAEEIAGDAAVCVEHSGFIEILD